MPSLLSWTILLTVFLVPLLTASGVFGYEHTKVLVFMVLILFGSIVWFVNYFKRKIEPTFVWTEINKTSATFLIILTLTSIFGINPSNSIFGVSPYFQGIILYLNLLLFSWLVTFSGLKINQVAYVLTTSSFLVSVLAIREWVLINIFNISLPTFAGRVVSTFGQPNFYAGFLLLTLPFTYYLFKKTTNRLSYLWLVFGLIFVIAIFISYSRSAILLVMMLLILSLTDQLKVKFKYGIIIFGVLLILGGSLLIASRFSSGLVEKEIIKPVSIKYPDLTKDPVEKRIYIWPQVLTIGQQRLLTGYGLENISQAFSSYFTVNKHSLFEENVNINPVLLSLKDLNLDRTHNYLLDLWLFSGIFGVLIYAVFVFVLFHKLLGQTSSGRGKNVLIVSLITYLVWIQLQNQSIAHLMYFWLLAGLIDSEAIDKR